MQRITVKIVKAYQYLIGPMLGQHCRFYPTCSEYAIEAIEHHGSLRGLMIAARRLLRCNPWAAGGYDPVKPLHEDQHHTDCCDLNQPTK